MVYLHSLNSQVTCIAFSDGGRALQVLIMLSEMIEMYYIKVVSRHTHINIPTHTYIIHHTLYIGVNFVFRHTSSLYNVIANSILATHDQCVPFSLWVELSLITA